LLGDRRPYHTNTRTYNILDEIDKKNHKKRKQSRALGGERGEGEKGRERKGSGRVLAITVLQATAGFRRGDGSRRE